MGLQSMGNMDFVALIAADCFELVLLFDSIVNPSVKNLG